MATVRSAIRQAMRLLKATAPGDDPVADELAAGLEATRSLILEIHEARGPMFDIDVPGRLAPWFGDGQAPSVCPGEDQRLRIQAGFVVGVTLPNSVSRRGELDPYDYGFANSRILAPQIGSTGAADGIVWHAPRDGARIEVVGTTQGLWFYRSDINAWSAALDLAIDAELPFSARLQSYFAALLAERMADELADLPQPTKAQIARIAHAREAVFSQTGRRRAPVRASYF
ncbi:MAG TPA: hypothetical protein VE309_03160 [Caulobacteraceae bacterium]|nr:hypothetical protein [Caulobacteraceae bacterium]